jgi:hypothetical protein
MNHMDIKGRILQSIRPRQDGVLLRSDVNTFGSNSQISAALLDLCRNGVLQRVERGVYVLPAKLEMLGKAFLLERAHQRQRASRKVVLEKTLANRFGVTYKLTYGDRWASAVTRLVGDEIRPDTTDNLLVALTREGKLTSEDMVKLVMEHHRALKSHV